MEKVNVRFHENFTVSYQHKKILQFVPELSVDKNLRITTPNIPLLVCFEKFLKSNMKLILFCHQTDAVNAEQGIGIFGVENNFSDAHCCQI